MVIADDSSAVRHSDTSEAPWLLWDFGRQAINSCTETRQSIAFMMGNRAVMLTWSPPNSGTNPASSPARLLAGSTGTGLSPHVPSSLPRVAFALVRCMISSVWTRWIRRSNTLAGSIPTRRGSIKLPFASLHSRWPFDDSRRPIRHVQASQMLSMSREHLVSAPSRRLWAETNQM